MESLLEFYPKKLPNLGGTVFDFFSTFYKFDLSPIDFWLECQFKNKTCKDNKKAKYYLNEGRKYLNCKDRLRCLESFTKCMSTATSDSELYSLALDYRCKVLYDMQEFKCCLKDIELCLKTDCSLLKKSNLYLRKAKCFFKTGQIMNMNSSIEEGLTFLKANPGAANREWYMKKLTEMKTLKLEEAPSSTSPENLYVLPKFEEENDKFAYASSKIKISYNKSKGRHVVAQKPILKGDILFVERAFAMAPIFRHNKDISPFKCYNCLKDMISCIPCHSCTICLYCGETCRETSWRECHRWECDGMQADLWYHLGIAFPGFRALLKGVRSGFQVKPGSQTDDVTNFGNKDDNYPYFNRLLSHIYKNKNAAPYLLISAVVVRYLKKYTEFFPWLLRQENCPKKDLDALTVYVGGLLTKHIGQLSCNSSVIEHCAQGNTERLFPDKVVCVACGIFPSVSMMNHSCKANITSSFICDTIIVKASEDIAEGQEIFNCYGIDYRLMSRDERQHGCRTLYFFECKCAICSNALLEPTYGENCSKEIL